MKLNKIMSRHSDCGIKFDKLRALRKLRILVRYPAFPRAACCVLRDQSIPELGTAATSQDLGKGISDGLRNSNSKLWNFDEFCVFFLFQKIFIKKTGHANDLRKSNSFFPEIKYEPRRRPPGHATSQWDPRCGSTEATLPCRHRSEAGTPSATDSC